MSAPSCTPAPLATAGGMAHWPAWLAGGEVRAHPGWTSVATVLAAGRASLPPGRRRRAEEGRGGGGGGGKQDVKAAIRDHVALLDALNVEAGAALNGFAAAQEVLEHELVAKRRTSLDAIRRGFCAVDLSSYLSIFSSSRELAELLTTAPQQQAQHAVTVAPAVPK